jgi:uncharacterized protein YndB with AHSA1/START domain
VPGFTLTRCAAAPVEEVWKLLFDPTRFPEWWFGVETVRSDGPDAYTMWPDGYPDFPMPQRLRGDRSAGRVVISCQVSDIDITWRLAEAGDGTLIEATVELPDVEAHRLPGQRAAIDVSLTNLAALAAIEMAEPYYGKRTPR